MSGPSDRRFDLNFGEDAAMPSQDNIWRPSFLSLTGLLTVGDSVMKNDMTVAVVARNLLTPKDNRLHSKTRNEAPNDQPSVSPPHGVLPSTEAPNNHPLVPLRFGALPIAETSPEQPL
ncbi:unnamed protein product [Malus baccata var. baccata]